MLAYTRVYEKYRPKNTLWLQHNFDLQIDDQTKVWIEENVNELCLVYGNEKCAFVVGQDVLAHLETIDVFEKTKSCIVPRHFASEHDARQWLENLESDKDTHSSNKVSFEGVDENGDVILKIPTKNIKHTLKTVQQSIQQESFIEEHLDKLELLTEREKEVLKLVVEGKKHQEIADQLFISLNTSRTHWRNIKFKLKFETEAEIKAFSKFL